jgi:hypothetical protein
MPSAAQGLDQARDLLTALLVVQASAVATVPMLDAASRVVDAGQHRFTLAWTASGAVGPVARAIERLEAVGGARSGIALVVTPYMGEAGAARCESAEVGWLDLSGNASIRSPGLHVEVRGKPNRFVRRGRPANPFAPKSARIARWLLMHPHTAWQQRTLADAVQLSEGTVSKVVRAYEAEGFVTRHPEDGVRVRDPELLLQAWREQYRFDRHQVRRGSIASRSGPDLVRTMSSHMLARGARSAFTGLAATWLWDGFAAFRTAVVFVERWPEPALADMAFVEETRGANAWFVLPDDDGVFHGATKRDSVAVVHPVQAYLDLDAQAERAPEAAEHLRDAVLARTWRDHG